MKRYFKRLLSEPITTVEQAEEIVKTATRGLYVIGLLGLAEGLVKTILENFYKFELPPNESFYILQTVLFIIGGPTS